MHHPCLDHVDRVRKGSEFLSAVLHMIIKQLQLVMGAVELFLAMLCPAEAPEGHQGLKVLLNMSWLSPDLNTAGALEQDSIWS